jgi:Zn-dependent peptidase ImmA (M78 family)
MVKKLTSKCGTYNALKIAEQLNIIVLYENLGTINGYFNCCYRQKFIHINENLSPEMQYYVLCHELGHAVLHPQVNVSFLKSFTYLNTDKFEKEADEFALELMMYYEG